MRGSKLNQAFSAQVFRTQNCMHLLHSICQIHCMITYLCVCTKMHVRVLAYGCIFAWVCACAYTFACVLSCVHACVYVCVRVHVPFRTYVCFCVCICAHRFACMYVCACRGAWMQMCAHAGVGACTYAWKSVRVSFLVLRHLRLETFNGIGLHALLILKPWCSWCCCFWTPCCRTTGCCHRFTSTRDTAVQYHKNNC